MKVELSGDTSFVYPSGNEASGMNIGQIIKIAFELRNITQKALDDEESSGEEESGADEEGESRREEMRQWFRFCKEKVEKIEKVWNRKLDAYEQPSDSDSDAGFDPSQDHDPLSMNDDDHEAVLDQMFKKFSDNKSGLSNSFNPRSNNEDLERDIAEGTDGKKSKDDSELEGERKEFADNQYWSLDNNQYDLDELLAEAEDFN